MKNFYKSVVLFSSSATLILSGFAMAAPGSSNISRENDTHSEKYVENKPAALVCQSNTDNGATSTSNEKHIVNKQNK